VRCNFDGTTCCSTISGRLCSHWSAGVFYNGLALTAINGLGVILSPKDSPGRFRD